MEYPSPQQQVVGVTREEAIKFLEIAIRNWSEVQELSEDDIGDVATALLWFLKMRDGKAADQARWAHAIEPVAYQQREQKRGEWSDWYLSSQDAYEERSVTPNPRYEVRPLYAGPVIRAALASEGVK